MRLHQEPLSKIFSPRCNLSKYARVCLGWTSILSGWVGFRGWEFMGGNGNVCLKGNSQLAHMRIRYHFIANLHITESRSILFQGSRSFHTIYNQIREKQHYSIVNREEWL